MKKDKFDDWYFSQYPHHRKLRRAGLTHAIAELNDASQVYNKCRQLVLDLQNFADCYQAALYAWYAKESRGK